MIFSYDTLPIEGKEVLRKEILELFDRDISTVPCGFSSRNYAFIFSDGCFPAIIRVGTESAYKKAKDVLTELMWLDDLRIDVPNVCQAMPSLKNRLVERITIGEQTYLASVFRKANGGVLPAKYWDSAYFYRTASLLGNIHRTSSEGAKRGFKYKRKSWSESPAFDFSHYSPYFSEEVQKDAEYVRAKIQSIPQDPRWYGMIHGDFQRYNFFYDWDTVWVFDFDDSCYGYFMFDIACLLHMFVTSPDDYFERFPNQTYHELVYGENGIYENIRKGYTEQWELPDEQWDLIDDFFRLRIAQTLVLQCCNINMPRDIMLALNMPSAKFLKYDQPPIEKVPIIRKEMVQNLTKEQREFLHKIILTS